MKLFSKRFLSKEYSRQSMDLMMVAVDQQVNGLAEGRIFATYNASTAAPTTGEHQRGDFVRNSEPSELGSAGSKYVIFGWTNVSAGSPGTWKECRFLTGN